jgi:hypothetical protein|tara:strand:+ start:11167 stop:11727 length:561 start_codon:yes stop_codon:yes gene_type:complete
MKRWAWLSAVLMNLMSVSAVQADESVAKLLATQEIEYLQRWYARATDLIGTNDPENIEEGRGVYHRIFTPDAAIRASDPSSGTYFKVSGPDEWVKVVDGALSVFDSTQHLLGTQIVDVESLPDDAGVGGSGSMTSYLQAWHHDPDRVIDIYLGTYYSKVRYTPGVGWQIYDMRLEKVAGEVIDKRT